MTLDRWLAVGGILISALVSWLISRYYYRRSDKKRRPTFIVQSQKLLSGPALTSVSGLSVLHLGENVGKIGITEAQVVFWNSGKLPILQDEILKPYKITLPVKVLSCGILKLSRDVVGLKLSANRIVVGEVLFNELTLEFAVLEPEDGATLQIIYDGPADIKMEFQGACLDAPKPTVLPQDPIYSVPRPKRLRGMSESIVNALAPLFVVVVVLAGGSWAIRKVFGVRAVNLAGDVLLYAFAAIFLASIILAVWYQIKRFTAPYMPPDVKP